MSTAESTHKTQIELDVPRTFPTHRLFKDDGDLGFVVTTTTTTTTERYRLFDVRYDVIQN
jgi:hypothetical protein